MAQESRQKSSTAKREEGVLAFWRKKNVFEQSLEKPAPKGEFIFYDGPPFATGLPHYGSLLSSIVKDVIPRYKTMRGYHVRRRWGWDCHGLPIENMIEKELGLKTKKDIEKMGIAKFNEACRASVLRYADAWKEYVERIGRWVEYDNAYKTMDVSYMESVWWALKRMHDKRLLYEGRKVLLYCPHCETPLAKAEVQMDNSYKDVTEEAVTVKFKLKNPEKIGLQGDVYLLAWTTTPWTLPGNVALAVGETIDYVVVRIKNQESKIKEQYVIAKNQADVFSDGYGIIQTVVGKELVGLEYEPLYEIDTVKKSGKKAWYVTDADFVTTDEGTGIVHTAVIYGEDDYRLGQQKDLPMVPLLDASGVFNKEAPALVQGTYFKKSESVIKEDLEKRTLLFGRVMHTHSYPHCHRCGTPLLYNAITSWFINIQKVKKRLIRLNKKVNWFPTHLKHGRFLNILKDAPDWTISRNRYWASPLPVWRCESCSAQRVVGSVAELKKHTKTSGNRYFVMRHAHAESNERGVMMTNVNDKDHLTERGKEEISTFCKRIKRGDIDLIISSPFTRTKETASRIAKHLGLKKEQLVFDDRIVEIDAGEFNHKPYEVFDAHFDGPDWFTSRAKGGESPLEVKKRMGGFLYDVERTYSNKKILIVTHGGPARMLFAVAEADGFHLVSKHSGRRLFEHTAGVEKLDFIPQPHDAQYRLDLHRPYIDEIVLSCVCGKEMRRISEVVDGWVESGSMPFAEYHYPFSAQGARLSDGQGFALGWENMKIFFGIPSFPIPGDFVSEYIGQTRTWFYYMHAVAGTLFRQPSFQNVVVTGNIQGGDGYKMSKSRGNYTDPLLNLDIYGADALRYYLMGSTVMQAEDVRFLDEELRESHNRVVNILSNVATFFDLYVSEEYDSQHSRVSEHVLDRWILARYSECVSAVTESLERYDTVRASRPIRDFIEDLSTWYVRRSRDRFKHTNSTNANVSTQIEEDRAAAATLGFVLREISKVIAPIMPFLAESVYQIVRAQEDPESVHLESWPEVNQRPITDDRQLLEEMQQVRDVVSRALEARARAGIKVRQPLATLTISTGIPEEYLFLIKEEVNVKEVVVDTEMVERTRLDTEMTDELREEGQLRDLIRHIQDLRKKENLDPSERIALRINTNEAGKEFVKKYEHTLRDATQLADTTVGDLGDDGESIVVGDDMRFTFDT